MEMNERIAENENFFLEIILDRKIVSVKVYNKLTNFINCLGFTIDEWRKTRLLRSTLSSNFNLASMRSSGICPVVENLHLWAELLFVMAGEGYLTIPDFIECTIVIVFT